MACQVCGRQVQTAQVSLNQNIGMLVARQTKSLSGHMCRECGMRLFKSMTLTTFFLGWWGVISLIVTPFFLIGNVIAWSSLRSLPQTPSEPGQITSG